MITVISNGIPRSLKTNSWRTIATRNNLKEAPNILASNFCYLTGVEGYTPEPNPPEWVSKTIENYNSKPKRSSTGGRNCDSPVHRNKPYCMDY